MKKQRLIDISKGIGTMKGFFAKTPLLLLSFLYIFFILIEKEFFKVYSVNAKEYYINNNHLKVSKLGGGSICVHANPLIMKPNGSLNVKY